MSSCEGKHIVSSSHTENSSYLPQMHLKTAAARKPQLVIKQTSVHREENHFPDKCSKALATCVMLLSSYLPDIQAKQQTVIMTDSRLEQAGDGDRSEYGTVTDTALFLWLVHFNVRSFSFMSTIVVFMLPGVFTRVDSISMIRQISEKIYRSQLFSSLEQKCYRCRPCSILLKDGADQTLIRPTMQVPLFVPGN